MLFKLNCRYAHIEGKKIKKSDKYEIRQLLIMVCCLLFSVSIAFPIMNWRYEAGGKLKTHHLVNVSIHMLKRDVPPEGHKFNLEITDILLRQGWTETNTSLVPSAWDIISVSTSSLWLLINHVKNFTKAHHWVRANMIKENDTKIGAKIIGQVRNAR